MKICSLRLRRNRLSGLLFLASCIAAFFFTSSIAVTGAETVSDRVEFLNGDVLRGKIEGVNNSSSVEFFSELLKTNITIKQTGIYKLYLESIDPIATNVSGNSIITLATDDSFGGNFVRYDNETLVVDTWFCGRIAIPRSMLKSFVPSAGASLVYEGPKSLDGWTVHNPGFFVNIIVAGNRQGVAPAQAPQQASWIYTNNAFYNIGQGALGKYFQLPDKTSIDFDLSWRGNLAFSVFFFSDTLTPYTGRAYMMLFTYRAAYLHRRGSPTGITVLGTAEIPEFAKETKASISIKVDKEQRTIALFVNGKLLNVWKDESDFVGDGNGIVFNQQSSSKVKISKIRITRWDGRLDSDKTPATKFTNDVVKLANKDFIEGKVLSINNGLLKIQTDYASIDIPMERVIGIDFSTKGVDIEKDKLVKGFLSDFGSFSFVMQEMSDKKIVGVCPGIGKLEFSPRSFRILQFASDTEQAKENSQSILDSFEELFE